MARISTDVGRFGGAQEQVRFGEGLQQAAGQLGRVALQAKKEADGLRVTDALGQLRRSATDLRFNTTDGYELLKKGDALVSEDGKSLSDRYSSKLDTRASEIEKSLGNADQKQLFREHAIPVSTGFRNGAEKYTHGQYVEFNDQVAIEGRDLALQGVTRSWNDDQEMDILLNGTVNPVTGKRLGGLKKSIFALTKSEADVKKWTSTFHSTAIAMALDNNNIARASSYYKEHQGELIGNDKIKTNAAIKEYSDVAKAQSVSAITVKKYQTAFVPNDAENFMRVVNPANPKDAVRLADLMAKYPTLDKTLAAYDAGDKEVDKAVKKAEKAGIPNAWITYLPKKTQGFVTKNLDAFKSGQGARPIPSEKEFVDSAVRELDTDAAPSTIVTTRKTAKARYKQLVGERKQRADNALEQSQKLLIELEGDYSKLPATVKMELAKYDPNMVTKAQAYATAIAESNEVVTNDELFNEIRSNPVILRDMTDAVFTQMRDTEFAPDDRKEITTMRNSMLTGTNSQSPDTLDHKTIKDTISNLLAQAGVDPKPTFRRDKKAVKRIANFTRFVEEDILRVQESVGRKLSSEEVSKRINELVVMTATADRFWRFTEERLFDIEFDDIPSKLLPSITDALKARGNLQPTESDMLMLYLRMRTNRANRTNDAE